jgi:hypothetical protein
VTPSLTKYPGAVESKGADMIGDVSGVSGVPEIIALGVVAVIFVTVLFWSMRPKSSGKS